MLRRAHDRRDRPARHRAASQALSSETSLDGCTPGGRGARRADRRHHRATCCCGATTAHDWLLPAPGGGCAGRRHRPRTRTARLSVLRYAQRTPEPLVVADATGDDRFARDPYLAGLDCCALLAVPDPQPRHAAGGAAAGEPAASAARSPPSGSTPSSSSPDSSPSPWTTPSSTPSFAGSPTNRPALRRVATLVARGVGSGMCSPPSPMRSRALFDVEDAA